MSEAAITVRPEAAVATMDAGNLMAALIQAASDPNTDVEKLERLGALYERLSARQAEQAFHDAMSAAQAELGRVATDLNNKQTNSRYASYPALDRAVRPVYTRHGFSLSFDTGEGAPADCVRVVCVVGHGAGHSRAYHIDMPSDGKGAKGGDVMTKTHATGAAMSYGQRYLLKLIFNIAVGEDDDGNLAPRSRRETSTAAQDAFATINACEGSAALIAWRDEKSQAVRPKVNDEEWSAIIALWNQRAKAAAKPDDAQ